MNEEVIDLGDKWEVINDVCEQGSEPWNVVLVFRQPGDHAAGRVTLTPRNALRFAHAIINEVNDLLSEDWIK